MTAAQASALATAPPLPTRQRHPVRVLPATGAAQPWTLHSIAATRRLESDLTTELPPHSLMQRAGLSVARLALALAPHARSIWVACGPGNNAGDGFEAAMHLHQWGKTVTVTWLGHEVKAPPDALAALQRARSAGVNIADEPPATFDLAIDGLLGIGAKAITAAARPHNATSATSASLDDRLVAWVTLMNQARSLGAAKVLAIDLPSGLNADTGQHAGHCVQATASLSLLTLKPGLFTGGGRDACGDIWFDSLGGPVPDPKDATAQLIGEPSPRARLHASHKGSYGDVAIVGGAPGMVGAALLAGAAAARSGAGRVFIALLDGGSLGVSAQHPQLMFRTVPALDFSRMTVVCGCGGGDAVRQHLSRVLSTSALAVIDADAINSIAADESLRTLLKARAGRGLPTVITPHPLEAARLAGVTTVEMQSDRLAAAQRLADIYRCVVALKGSGTVVAAPGLLPHINPSGNALLATAGTGDVLAGMVGAALAALPPNRRMDAVVQAACEAVFRHGQAADRWPHPGGLDAPGLIGMLR